MISELAVRISIHRALKVYCQPFVSSAELQECVLGHKHQVKRGYRTLCLPRLQLRALAILEVGSGTSTGTSITECKQLLTKLSI